MPTPKTQQLKSWSFSRYSDFTTCPAYAKFKHLDRLPEPKGPALDRGSAIHKLAEEYTTGTLKRLPAELKLFSEEFKMLRKAEVLDVEGSWTFTAKWEECAWDDWNRAWLRVKVDCAYWDRDVPGQLVIVDHKTGKLRGEKNADYMKQLELYALAGFKRNPEVDSVRPELWYLDEGVIWPAPADRVVYIRTPDEKALTTKWERRVRPMLKATGFKPTPNARCRYCAYSAAKDGPCKY